MSFSTPVALCGPMREPRQMLADQAYQGHASIHDDAMAERLGFRAGPIEGPTHFSLFPPLMDRLWGQAWFERGCLSTHFANMVVEGEATRAFVDLPAPGTASTRAWVEKADGTLVLEASASLGPDHGTTMLEARLARLRPPQRLLILEDLKVGMAGAADERVRMDPDQILGALYPFSLRQKLSAITESSPWYDQAAASPWGRPIIPLEMISVLTEYTAEQAGWPVRQPVVGLFLDQEIRLIDGPLFVGEDYLLRREIVGLSESRRTESYWIRTRIFDASGVRLLAEVLLHHGVLKDSYAGYQAQSESTSA